MDFEKLAAAPKAEPSTAVAARVKGARDIQEGRFSDAGLSGIHVNAEMTPPMVRDFVQSRMDDAGLNLLRIAVNQLNLSARSFHRLLKISRTVADLAGAERVEPAHVAEAIQYRDRIE